MSRYNNDFLDVYALNERLEELTALETALSDANDMDEGDEDKSKAIESAESDFGPDEREELRELVALRDEIGEDRHGLINTDGGPFVNESYFAEYVKEMLADIGDIPRDLPSYIVIDWDTTAKNIKVDYSSVDFGGETYLYRA